MQRYLLRSYQSFKWSCKQKITKLMFKLCYNNVIMNNYKCFKPTHKSRHKIIYIVYTKVTIHF